jgi:hypothetical protein
MGFRQDSRGGYVAAVRKGPVGNPAGRKVGCRNKTTMAAATLLAGEAEALTRKAIELALVGAPWTFSPRA